MTETEWLTCQAPWPMLDWLRSTGRGSDRKRKLFACGCVRLIWDRVKEPLVRGAVWTAESNADEPVADTEQPSISVHTIVESYAFRPVIPAGQSNDPRDAAQAILLRHIFGNPFRPLLTVTSWPTPVVQLAEAVYDGTDATFALHDALLEAGHPDLAEHFRGQQWHPKGCWGIDVILGRG